MGLIGNIRELMKLQRDGKLDALLRETENLTQQTKNLTKQKENISASLSGLEADIQQSKARLGGVVDTVVRRATRARIESATATHHESFETVYRVIAAGCAPFLVGPAGSGKSTILAQVANEMGLPFYPMSVNALTSDYNIIGYNDANGKYVPTIFRRAYESGGIFSFEEIDAGNPNVMTVINNAMSQNKYAFPDKIVEKHPQFILAASGNTYGTGANIQYIGRNPLDAATLDRFVMVWTGYDTQLEKRLCSNKEWIDYIHAVRKFVAEYQIKLVCGTRAVINGEKLLNAGLPRAAVENMVVFKGLPTEDIEKIRANVLSRQK